MLIRTVIRIFDEISVHASSRHPLRRRRRRSVSFRDRGGKLLTNSRATIVCPSSRNPTPEKPPLKPPILTTLPPTPYAVVVAVVVATTDRPAGSRPSVVMPSTRRSPFVVVVVVGAATADNAHDGGDLLPIAAASRPGCGPSRPR